MIYAVGLAADGTFAHFVSEAHRQGAAVTVVDLGEVMAAGDWAFALPDHDGGLVSTVDGVLRLDPAASFYTRVSEGPGTVTDEASVWRWRGLTAGLVSWLDQIPGRVVNRPGAWCDNSTKPLHEVTLRRLGFAVPDSVTSSDPARLAAFAGAGPAIAKTLSGVRADAHLVSAADFAGFTPASGPVHLQRFITGLDVRVHVCGEDVHTECARTDAADYRVADADVRFAPWRLPPELAERLVTCTHELGLGFAGWDFKLDGDGTYWCLETNPMPGYDWYDRRCDGAITRSLLALLAGAP